MFIERQEPVFLNHEEFFTRIDTHTHVWGVKRFDRAVRTVFGLNGTLWLNFARGLLLIPSIGLAVAGVVDSRYGLCVWSMLAAMGFRAGSPGPTAVGMATCLFFALIGFAVSVQGGWLHLVGGILPGVTWFGSCVVQGVTMESLEHELRRSPEFLQKLESEDNLLFVEAPKISGSQSLPDLDVVSSHTAERK